MPRLVVVLAFAVVVALAAFASAPSHTGALAIRASSESMQHRTRAAGAGYKPNKSKVSAAKHKNKAKHKARKEKHKNKKAADHKNKKQPHTPPTPAPHKEDRKKQPTPTPTPGHSTPYIYGVDICVAQTKDAFDCFINGAYTGPRSRVVPQQAKPHTGSNYPAALQSFLKTKSMQKVGIRVPLLSSVDALPTIHHAIHAGYTGAGLDLYYIDFRADASNPRPVAPYTSLLQMTSAQTHVHPKELVALLGAYIKPVAAKVGTLWLDVETGNGYWAADLNKNCEYLTKVVQLIQADTANFPMKLGIYTGQSGWPEHVGSTCNFAPFANLPLWYSAYGPELDSFTPFSMSNAWKTPYAHQWHGTTDFCGTSVDFNIYKSM